MTAFIDHPLDQNGALTLRISFDPETGAVEGGIVKNDQQRFMDALAKNVVDRTQLKIGDQIVSLTPVSDDKNGYAYKFDASIAPDSIVPIDVMVGTQRFGHYSLDSGKDELTGKIEHRLTASETRFLAGSIHIPEVPYDRSLKSDFLPITDLHTHLAGNLTGKKLLELGLQKPGKPIIYPNEFLKQAGINLEQYAASNKGVALKDLKPDDLSKLEATLEIAPDMRIIPSELNGIYAIRKPITKEKEMFPILLRAIAEDYAAQGIKYAELSEAGIVTDPDLIRIAYEALPQIEAETGVKLRFLAGIWRHADKEWNQDEIDRIKAIASNPYVIGVDFMGNETNPTRDIADEIKEITRWAIQHDPNFTIRVHATENPLLCSTEFKSAEATPGEFHNLKETLLAILQARKEEAEHRGVSEDKVKLPKIRIGHGLYGVDDETIALVKKTGAVIEFNLSSNIALNNVDSISEVPIKAYLDHGIPVVFGSDGRGVYQTDAQQEALLAKAAGITPEQFATIHTFEVEHIQQADHRFAEKSHEFDALLQPYADSKQTNPEIFAEIFHPKYKDGKPRYDKSITEAKVGKDKTDVEAALKLIKAQGAQTDSAITEQITNGKTPILITGASKANWGEMSPSQQSEAETAMQVLANQLDPKKAYLVTGGTNYGVEKTMHEAAHRRNAAEASGDQLNVVGLMTLRILDNPKKNAVEPNTITHGTIAHLRGKPCRRWAEFPDACLELVKKGGGVVVAVGGSYTVKNMIQRAHNMGLPLCLMDGAKGASTEKSRVLQGHGYDFVGAEGLLKNLYAKQPDLFQPDFDISKAQEYVAQAKAQIEASKPGSEMEQAVGGQALNPQKQQLSKQ